MLLSEDESWPTSSRMLAPAPGVTEATAAKKTRMARLFSPLPVLAGENKKTDWQRATA